MKSLCVLLLCLVVCGISGELIQVLHRLQESEAFNRLSTEDKVSVRYSISTQGQRSLRPFQ